MDLESDQFFTFFLMSFGESVILGIDPGTNVTGYGVVRLSSGKITALDFGCIKTPKNAELPQKYRIIFEGIELLIDKFKPLCLAVETQFVKNNIPTAMKIGMARGMALLAAARRDLPIFEYPPKKAKLAVVGVGSASKEQVQKTMQLLLNIKEPITPEDAADALAIAFCHAHQQTFKEALHDRVYSR